jgi:hypothetical protein
LKRNGLVFLATAAATMTGTETGGGTEIKKKSLNAGYSSFERQP